MTFGLPQVVLPQTCVHFQHGDRLAEVGAAVSLHPGDATAGAIRDALTGLLENPDAGRAAAALRDENARQPSLGSVVEKIETSLGVAGT
jgi:UDP:flavonoid glycosyltransferase YjiC (YdhE family)